MKIWTYKELRAHTTDGLLDELSSFLELKNDISNCICSDIESADFYNKECLVNYDLNIRKIENELTVRSKKYS